MAIMGKKVWAAVCGAVRQEFELFSILAWLCEQRSKGMIDGIVLSTWIGEVDRIPELRCKLQYLDINVVEQPPIDDGDSRHIGISYLRQAVQLQKAINYIPDDVFVLKCRTDFCLDTLNGMLSVLCGVDLSIRPLGSFMPSLHYKVVVTQFGISASFCLNDICFLGYKQDICKMLLFDSTCIKYTDFLAPDMLFFINPFRNEFPVIDEFLRRIDYWVLTRRLLKYSDTFDEKFVLPGVLNKYYALYFVILYCCFYMLPGDEEDRLDEEPIDAMDIFRCERKIGMIKSWITILKNRFIVEKIVTGNIALTDGSRKLYGEILKMERNEYAKSISYTEEDYKETIAFGRKYLQTEPRVWVKDWYAFAAAKPYSVDFSQAAQILFSDYGVDHKTTELLKDICMNGKDSFYKQLQDRTDDLSLSNKKISQLALFASARNLNASVMKKIAGMLLRNEIVQEYIPTGRFVFERYKKSPKLYCWPMSADQMAAVYLYGKYAESCNDVTMARNFCESLIYEFQITAEAGKTQSYSDKSLSIMRNTVEKRYEEYFKSDSIKNIVTCLLEIDIPISFSDEVMTYLSDRKII